MKTDDLIAKLSSNLPTTRTYGPTTTVLITVGVSCFVVILMTAVWLGLRIDLGNAILGGNHDFLLNVVFVISIASIATAIVRDLSVPGRSLTLPTIAIIAPFVLLGSLAVHELGTVSLHEASRHADGEALLNCFWRTLVLALLALSILAIGIRRLAPIDLCRAGCYLGFLAGAIGALGHCLHAPNHSLAFGVVAYSTPIVVMALVGGIIGPRLLRWR